MLALVSTLVGGPGILAADASGNLSGTTLFVSATGDDSKSGASSGEAVREIQRAIDLAPGGSTIQISAGSYQSFIVQNRTDLRIIGEAGVAVSDGRYERSAAVAILDSQRISVEDLALSRSLWGVKVEGSSGISLLRLNVSDTGQEGIHVHRYSSDVTIADSHISDTGNRGGQYAHYGEGIYIGTGSGLNDDDTHDIRILRNTISATTSEAIDIKQSVYNVRIEGNLVHDINTNTSGAVVVGIGIRSYRDPNVLIRGNILWNISTNTRWTDGNAISLSASSTVEANVIWGTEHHGILMDGNFASSNKTVSLRSNAVFQTGRDAIGHWTDPNPAQPQLSSNLTAGDAENALGSSPRPSGDNPGANVIQLRDSLVASLGGAPIQQPAPKPTPAPTPTTTPAVVSPTSTPQTPAGRTPSTTTPESKPATTLPGKASQPNSPAQGGHSAGSPTASPQSIAEQQGFTPTEMAAVGQAGDGPAAANRSVQADHTPGIQQPDPLPTISILESELEISKTGVSINEFSSDTDNAAPEQLGFNDPASRSGKSSHHLVLLLLMAGSLSGFLVFRRAAR